MGYTDKYRYLKQLASYPALLKKKIKGSNLPLTKFVIFGQGRTGSTLLVDLLNNHPSLFCDGEILNAKLYGKAFNIQAFINSRAAMPQKQVYGFKVKIYQLTEEQNVQNPTQFLLNLQNQNWKIIYLKRNNIFRHALSGIVAEATNVWHVTNANKNQPKPKVHINLTELEKTMRYRKKMLDNEALVLKNVDNYLTITYETDLLDTQNHQLTANKIFEFLNLPTAIANSALQRTIKDDLSKTIENYDEVMQFLETQIANF